MRPQCCADVPMPREDASPRRWQHPDAVEIPDTQMDGWPSGDTVDMKCPHCGHRFTVELAQ